MLLLVGVNQAYNVFGTPIFQGYYTVHQQLGNGRARLGFVPNNVSRKTKLTDGTTIRQLLKYGNQSSYTVSDGQVESTGWYGVYIAQFVTAGLLFVLFWYVALPGFEDFVGGDKPLAGVIGLSLCYFVAAGLFQAFGLDPLFVYLFVSVISGEAQTLESKSEQEDMLFFGKALYWSFIVGIYFLLVKPQLKSRYEAKTKTETQEPADIQKLQQLIATVQ